MKRIASICFLIVVVSGCFAQKQGNLSVELAKTIMQRHPDPNSYPYRSWCYPQGYMLMGMAKLFSSTNDSVYYRYIMKYADEHVDSLGTVARFKGSSMDDMMAGTVIVWAYRQTGLEKYRKAAEQIRRSFDDYPRTSEGLFWHGRKTKGEVWVDGVFMGQLFLTSYGKYVGDSDYCFNEAAKQLTGIYRKLHKGDSGLLYHGWDEDRDAKWADPQTGLSPEVWSEGLGWYALVLVETLEIFPEKHPQRHELEQICRDLMAGLKNVQDTKTGLWYQVVDKGEIADNWHDTSGSAMFLYAIKKAGELGLINAKSYRKVIEKAYAGIRTKAQVNPDDGLTDIVDACDGLCVQPSYDVYINYKKKVNAKEAVAGVLWGSWIVEKKEGKSDLKNWPRGCSPKEVGIKVANRFVASPHQNYGRPTPPKIITYPEVCAWYGALTFAKESNNKKLKGQLAERFEPLFGKESSMIPVPDHVDYAVFGSVPLELYIQTHSQKYLDLGKSIADKQWGPPEGPRVKPESHIYYNMGLTWQTRLWIDDMFMITAVQAQAYRATGDVKYIERAAKEMVVYLDSLQRPNGLFFHAPDVPFFWGRGDGWMAAGMSELLRSLPENNTNRPRIMEGYKKMMASLLKYQAENGMWRQLIDDPESWYETSCTGMFTFAFITGVKNGWLDEAVYGPAARKAWLALITYINKDGDITEVCEGTNKKNDRKYYLDRKRNIGDMHGQAPVLWCATALLRK